MRYFFDIRSRHGHAKDQEGLDLNDDQEVEVELLRLITSVACNEFAERPRGQVTGFVRDADGKQTYTGVIMFAATKLR